MGDGRYILGGRPFLSISDSTIEHDLYFHGLAGRAGLRFEMGQGETAGEFGERILDATIQSGTMLELLGCLIVPEEVGPDGWTPAEAQQTAAFISQLRGADDKAAIRSLVLSLLTDFFQCGLASIWTSPRSSRPSPGPESQPAPNLGEPDPRELPSATAAGPDS
jgi:hypothetical protein